MRSRFPFIQHPKARATIEISALVSGSLLIFFLFFQPAQIQRLPPISWWGMLLSLLVLSGVVLSLGYGLFQRGSRLKGITRHAGMIAVSLFLLGGIWFLYFRLLGFVDWNGHAFLQMQMRAWLIGLSPMVAFVLVRHRRAQPTPSTGPIPSEATLHLTAKDGTAPLRVKLVDLLFITSADNYVYIYTLRDGAVQKTLLRTTLSRVETAIKAHPNLFRCHRTAIVNLDKIKTATGNAQGYRLHFAHTDRVITVARSKVAAFRARFTA